MEVIRQAGLSVKPNRIEILRSSQCSHYYFSETRGWFEKEPSLHGTDGDFHQARAWRKEAKSTRHT